LIGSSLRQANQRLIDPNQVYRLMVLAKGLRSRSRYCWSGTDIVDSRAVATLKVRVLTAFVVSFASAMPQLECKNGVSLSILLSILCQSFSLKVFVAIGTVKSSLNVGSGEVGIGKFEVRSWKCKTNRFRTSPFELHSSFVAVYS